MQVLEERQLSYLGEIDPPGRGDGTRYTFIAEIQSVDFDVYEGQGKVAFTKDQLKEMNLNKFTPTTKEAIEKYILRGR